MHIQRSITYNRMQLTAASQHLTSLTSADSPILKYEPVLAFFVLREKSCFCLQIS